MKNSCKSCQYSKDKWSKGTWLRVCDYDGDCIYTMVTRKENEASLEIDEDEGETYD